MHHDGRGLTHGAAQVNISRLGDAPREVALARRVSRRGEADPRPHFPRRRKAGEIIDSRPEGQGDNCADASHGHQPAAYWVILSQLADTALQPGQFLPQGRPRPKHRFCCILKHGIPHNQFPDAQFTDMPAMESVFAMSENPWRQH
jgi:hypothetical protein